MPELSQQAKIEDFELRAGLPKIFRVVAVALLALTIITIAIGFFLGRNNEEFRMKGMPATLSKEIVAVVNGYERYESDGEVVRYVVRADKATTYTDNHQSLENVYLEVFDGVGQPSDKLSSDRAIYVPGKEKNFDAFLDGNVNIETRDGLKIHGDQISYNKEFEIAETELPIEFSRENLSGNSIGAKVFVKEKRIQLLKQVVIHGVSTGGENDQLANSNLQDVLIESDRAEINQLTERATADGNVRIEILGAPSSENPQAQKTTMRSERVSTSFLQKKISRFELNENVFIATSRAGFAPTNIKAESASYEKREDKFELKRAVEITVPGENGPTIIHSASAQFFQSAGNIFLNGGSKILRGDDILKGDEIFAEISPDNKIRRGQVNGNALVRQVTDKTVEVTANQIDTTFDLNQKFAKSIAKGNVNAVSIDSLSRLSLDSSDSVVVDFQNGLIEKMVADGSSSISLIPTQPKDYSQVRLTAPRAINLAFRINGTESLLSEMRTEGRTTITMNARAGDPNGANKKLTADSISTVLAPNGKDLRTAEAVGNAVLNVEPLRNGPENFRTTINAPRFDCEFYETGNHAKTCEASKNAKGLIEPTIPSPNRGARNLSAAKLVAVFSRETDDLERLNAVGKAKFNELDRYGIADEFVYTSNDQIVRLRGGEPTVWDSNGRARATQIDWDLRNEKSSLRERVSTTYYSQKQTNGATPFGKVTSPVFITSDSAEFDQRNQGAVYNGNARAWQEDNFIRADQLVIEQKARRMKGEGKVQSYLYNARRREGDKSTVQPASASSDRFEYQDEAKLIRYTGNVDIRQGTERITAGVVDVFLDEKNELKEFVAQNSVVITQPNRKVRGDYARFAGSPAMHQWTLDPFALESLIPQGQTIGEEVTA